MSNQSAQLSAVWPCRMNRDVDGALTLHGISCASLVEQFGSPLYVYDTEMIAERAAYFYHVARRAFHNTTVHVSYAGKAFLSKEIARIVTEAGLLIDTCSFGEMSICEAAGVPARRLVLHGNNKTDEEILHAIRHKYNKIVVDSLDELHRVEALAQAVGVNAKVMIRVTSGIHAGGHEYISTAHEDQKFGIPLLPADSDVNEFTALWDAYGFTEHSVESVDNAVVHALQTVMDSIVRSDAFEAITYAIRSPYLDVEGVHSHIGSQIHDAQAFIEAARRLMVLRYTVWSASGFLVPETDLGGGFSVAYTDDEESMDVAAEMEHLAEGIRAVNAQLGVPMPSVSFEPGRWIIAPTGITLYRVGTIKPVVLHDEHGKEFTRTYVSVDGGMSDNIRPALYGAQYTIQLAATGNNALPPIAETDTQSVCVKHSVDGGESESDESAVNRTVESVNATEPMLVRVVGAHCESGDIIVHEAMLPSGIQRGDIVAVPVTGAYGRVMSSSYNQFLRPSVIGINSTGAHYIIKGDTIHDLLAMDVSE